MTGLGLKGKSKDLEVVSCGSAVGQSSNAWPLHRWALLTLPQSTDVRNGEMVADLPWVLGLPHAQWY